MNFRDWMDNFEFDLPEFLVASQKALAACNSLLPVYDREAIMAAAACPEYDEGAVRLYRARAGYDRVAVNAFDARRGIKL